MLPLQHSSAMLDKADLAIPVSKEIESFPFVLEIAQNWTCLGPSLEMQRSVGYSWFPVMTSWVPSGVLSSFPRQKSAPLDETSRPMSFFIEKSLRSHVAWAVAVALEVEAVLVVSVLVASLVDVVVSEDVLVPADVLVSTDVLVSVDVEVPVEDGVVLSSLGKSLAP